ncbi:hypothetical protein ACFUV2_09240 [Streptomyces pilosus]|uniref:hypothetical protein n=1 Tax=Streptomyces pilosus TaxID=28893 RepID=UPI003629DDA9
MQEWIAALVGLLGAAVGAGAAMWGAHRAARASQEALAVQVRKEDERWRRDQRHTAYQAMFRADMAQQAAAKAVIGERHTHDDELSPELKALITEAHEEALAALSLIELCGPLPVLETAEELEKAGLELMQVYSFPRSQENFTSAAQRATARHWAALKAFRTAARDALGYSNSGDWTPSS